MTSWGVLGFVDVLGFKGIGSRGHALGSVLASLSSIQSYLQRLVADARASDGGDMWRHLETDVRMFSDTVIIASPMPPPLLTDPSSPPYYEAIRRYMLLRHMVLMFTRLTTAAVNGEVPLLYRGCIACGEFQRNDFAVVGPAVDEGGDFYEAAEGAFVFLAPTAREAYLARPGLLAKAMFPYFVNYNVPLKKGASLATFAMNPLLFRGRLSAQELTTKILEAFGPLEQLDASVQTKYRNTVDYLAFLNDWTPPWGDWRASDD